MLLQLVDFAIWSLFNREKKPGAWPKHLLCDGFRKKAREGDPNGTSIPDVYSLYPNHHAAALKQEPWPHVLALLGRSGQKIMIDLLVERSIFVTVEAGIGNYYQISGKLEYHTLTGYPQTASLVLTMPRRSSIRH